MRKVNVFLNDCNKVQDFVHTISKFDCEFDLCSGRYMVDAKSIMGVFALDLSKPVELHIHDDHFDTKNIERFFQK